MPDRQNTYSLGLGKTLYHSSVSLLELKEGQIRPEATLVLSERLSRKKNSGSWPTEPLRKILPHLDLTTTSIAENRDVLHPKVHEEQLNTVLPFFESLQQNGLAHFSSHFNSAVQFVPHHLCHAMAAVHMSPFAKALIVVIDGAGTAKKDFSEGFQNEGQLSTATEDGSVRDPNEEISVYLFDQNEGKAQLVCQKKNWRSFVKSHSVATKTWSEGLGIFYETASEFIFNCNQSSGKVMGLAPFGEAVNLPGSRTDFLESLPWKERSFQGGGKKAWENHPHLQDYKNLAATVQGEFERFLFPFVQALRSEYPEYENIILTGGCALNCTFNGKLVRQGLFNEVYVPPFPGDESISLGAAAYLHYILENQDWHPLVHEQQHGYLGATESNPTAEDILRIFEGFEIARPAAITEHVANLLQQGEVIAWFQGRSEAGPRALGNRSILARPDQPGLKDRLNANIKFREAFRPYGASCLFEKAGEYFEIPENFNSPYMSFAIPVKVQHKITLKEVTHVDGTCRFQSVRSGQNKKFYELIKCFGDKTGLYCLLNTSLNVMGEPIIETAEDARRFLLQTPVHGLAIGDYYIQKVKS
ncbi:MAG: carbamoyltransferase C-terminal domain-containing protein [Bdellovibrio sp.]